MELRKHYVLAILIVFGLALGIYLLPGPEQDRFGSQDDSSQALTAEFTDQSNEPEDTDNLETHGSDFPAEESSPIALNIDWRQRPEPPLDWREYSTKTYAELRALAEAGNGHAAAMLAYGLGNCSYQPPPQSSDEIAAAAAEMRRTHLVPVYRDGVIDRMMDFNNSLESLDSQIDRYEKSAKRCSAFTVRQRAEWEYWTNIALVIGGPVFGFLHNNLQTSMDKDDYSQLMSDLWDAGDPTALFVLGGINKRAAWQDYDTLGQIRGYAYDLAILTLLIEFESEFGIPPNNQSLDARAKDLLSQRSRMHEHEIREAEKLAKEIIESNDSCCLTWPDYFFDNE